MKKHLVIIINILFILTAIISPFIINELYKTNKGYLVLWEAKDMLIYVSSIISVLATIFISCITVLQNNKANEISNRLLNLEELNVVPCFSIISDKTNFFEYYENTIHLQVHVKNIGDGIIDIENIHNFSFHILQSDKYEILKFVKKGLDYPTVLPKQEKQLDFSIAYHDDNPNTLYDINFISESKLTINWNGSFDIILIYQNSEIKYRETINMSGNIFFSLSNDLSIREQKITKIDYKLKKISSCSQ